MNENNLFSVAQPTPQAVAEGVLIVMANKQGEILFGSRSVSDREKRQQQTIPALVLPPRSRAGGIMDLPGGLLLSEEERQDLKSAALKKAEAESGIPLTKNQLQPKGSITYYVDEKPVARVHCFLVNNLDAGLLTGQDRPSFGVPQWRKWSDLPSNTLDGYSFFVGSILSGKEVKGSQLYRNGLVQQDKNHRVEAIPFLDTAARKIVERLDEVVDSLFPKMQRSRSQRQEDSAYAPRDAAQGWVPRVLR